MKLLKIIFITILVSFFVYSQENTKDTLKTILPSYKNVNPFEFDMPDFELYRSLYFSDNKVPGNVDSNSIWLWTSVSLSQQNSHHFLSTGESPHMLSNFHDMYIEKSRFNIVRSVLGAVQVGAVGFLAYKSIKKYGFFGEKKK